MKKLRLFILVLLSSSITAHACGFYPYGDELRFCFFRPEFFGFGSFSEFNYTASHFEPKDIFDDGFRKVAPNDELWFHYCKGNVPYAAIRQAVYEVGKEDIHPASPNAMLQYLYKTGDSEAIAYLTFAKTCERLNEFYTDPWERNDYAKLPQSRKKIEKAIVLAKNVKNDAIRMRYNFLAIRMAFYSQQRDLIKSTFDSAFSNLAAKDAVYYWSLHFRALVETDSALAFFYAAQVFANAPEKRFAIYNNTNTALPISKALSHARTPKEKANVYLFAAVHRPDRALAEIAAMYRNDPSSEGLAFLLLREVNKIEDWVYTPYYSLFAPSVDTYEPETDYKKLSALRVLERVETDRRYAAELLAFIKSADTSKVNNPLFWLQARAQLEFITKLNASCLDTIKKLQRTSLDEPVRNQLEMLKALALIAAQPYGNAVIPEEVKPVVRKNAGNQKFIFAVGRELEYKGNYSDAACMYSMVNNDDDAEYSEGRFNNTAHWKSKKNAGETYHHFYSDYFGYINGVYTPQQLAGLIKDVERNEADSFSAWKVRVLKNNIAALYDLLGTKYIRQDKLSKALACFDKVKHAYNGPGPEMWERHNGHLPALEGNPFYEINYTPRFIPIKDNIRLTKYSVTKQLITYLDRANNPKEKDRDYYYFLVANCYFNMTQYGNCWMMRRYNWSSAYTPTVVEDEREFNEALLAQKYYSLALKYAHTDKFRALCLRMLSHSESISRDHHWWDQPPKNIIARYDLQLQKQYPEYYTELGSCASFKEYFRARR